MNFTEQREELHRRRDEVLTGGEARTRAHTRTNTFLQEWRRVRAWPQSSRPPHPRLAHAPPAGARRPTLLTNARRLGPSPESKIRELISALDMRKDEAIERTFKGVAKNFREVGAAACAEVCAYVCERECVFVCVRLGR